MLTIRPIGVGVAPPGRARLSAQSAQPPVAVASSAHQQRTRASAEASTSRRVSTVPETRSWSARDGTEVRTPPVPIPDPRKFWDKSDIAWEMGDTESWHLPARMAGRRRRERSELRSAYDNSAGMRRLQYSADYRCATPVTLDILEPEGFEPGTEAPVILVLPFYAGHGPEELGDALFEVTRLNFVEDTGAVVVRPVFNTWPLFVDGADDAHEAYMNQVLVPHLKELYKGPVSLISFGLGGWSALTLLLRNPDLYFQAAVFNAPLMLSRPPAEDHPLASAFGSSEEMRPYALPFLVEEEGVAAPFRQGAARIGLFAGPSETNRREMLEFSYLLGQNGILHTYCDEDEVTSSAAAWEPATYVVQEEVEEEEVEAFDDDGIRSLDDDEDEEEEGDPASLDDDDDDAIMMEMGDDDGLLDDEEEDGERAQARGAAAAAPADQDTEAEEGALVGAAGEAEGWDGSGGEEEEEGAAAGGDDEEEDEGEEVEDELIQGPSWMEYALQWTVMNLKADGGAEGAAVEAEAEVEAEAAPAVAAFSEEQEEEPKKKKGGKGKK